MPLAVRRLGGQVLAGMLAIFGFAAVPSDLRLVSAAERQDLTAVRRLLKDRVDVNAGQEDGTTPVAWAAHWDDMAMVELLIEARANVNLATDLGVTPLSLACTNGNLAMIERLLKAGANPNATRSTGETPLMTCARTGNVAALNALLAKGADVNAKQMRGQTALMWAVAERHGDAVRSLIERRADVNARSTGGFTPLLFAGQQGSLEIAQLLVAAGATLNDTAADGSSPLLLATSGTHPVGDANVSLDRPDALPLFLVKMGANPNLADEYGYTPLHWAAQSGKTDLVKALLASGALPNVRVKKDPPPPSGSFTYTTRGLAGATPFWLATRASHLAVMQALAVAGADSSLATMDNVTPLSQALRGSGGGGRGGRGGAMAAGAPPNLELLRVIVQAYPDVNAANNAGQTPLHAAATAGGNELIEMLVKKGAKLDVKDKNGETPLTIAERQIDKSAAELLRKLTESRNPAGTVSPLP